VVSWRLKRIIVILSCLFIQPVVAQDLLETYQQVLKSDPRLLIDTLGVEVGVAREKQSFGQLLPQVNLSSSATSTTRRAEGQPIDHYSGQRYILSVRQPLLDIAKYNAWQRSKSVQEQFQYQYEDTQSVVMLDTVERYFALLKANGDLDLIKEEKVAVLEKKNQISALYEKRLVKVTELYEMVAHLDMLESEQVEGQRLLALAKANLSELTGEPVQRLSPLMERSVIESEVGDINTHVEQLATRNASLNALGKSIDAARKNLNQQKAGHYPVVDLQLSKQQTNIGFENSLSAITDTEVASVSLSMPIFSGGTTSAKIYEATQQLKIAKASYDQEYRRLEKELKDEYFNVQSINRRVSATGKSIESAEKSYRSIEKSFGFGIATTSEVLDAQQLYLQAKQYFQQAEYDYVVSQARFAYKAGLLTDNSLSELNKQLAKDE